VSQARAIEGIEAGQWHFWVSVEGKALGVVVATGPSGRKYLKTEADGVEPTNLLRLPECP
jgi:hypothetical protein